MCVTGVCVWQVYVYVCVCVTGVCVYVCVWQVTMVDLLQRWRLWRAVWASNAIGPWPSQSRRQRGRLISILGSTTHRVHTLDEPAQCHVTTHRLKTVELGWRWRNKNKNVIYHKQIARQPSWHQNVWPWELGSVVDRTSHLVWWSLEICLLFIRGVCAHMRSQKNGGRWALGLWAWVTPETCSFPSFITSLCWKCR